MSKNWQEAGDAYVKAGEIYEKNLKEPHDACTRYIEAARAYRNVDTKAAIKYFGIAVDMHMEGNRFSVAAKLYKDIAELYEKEMDHEGAKQAFTKAADWYAHCTHPFTLLSPLLTQLTLTLPSRCPIPPCDACRSYDAEDSTANSTSCWVKVAALSAELEDYKKAIEIYERISNKALEGSSAGRWGVKDYLFKALLCHLVLAAKKNDMAPVEAAVDKYKDMLPQLDGTREVKLIEDLCAAFKEDDMDLYSDTVFRYDEIYKLDNWTAKVLLDVKNIMKNGPEGGKEDDFS